MHKETNKRVREANGLPEVPEQGGRPGVSRKGGGEVITVIEDERSLLRMLIDNVPDHIYIKDAQSRFVLANAALARHMGVNSSDELIGKTDFDFYPKDLATLFCFTERTVMESGRPLVNKQEPGLDREGNKMWFLVNKIPLRGGDGTVVGLVGSSRDISQLKRVEELVLGQSALFNGINRVLRETLTSDSDEDIARACLAVACGLTDSSFGFIGELNPAGRFDTIAISDPGWDACRMPKSDAVKVTKDMEVRGIWGAVLKGEKPLLINDPSSHPGSVGVPSGYPPITSFLAVPFKRKGKIVGIIALANKKSGYGPGDQKAIEDLSAAFVEALYRKRAEEALRDSEALFHSLVESIPLNVFRKDLEGRFVFGNELFCRTLGKPVQEIVGKTDFDFFPKELAEKYRADDKTVAQTQKLFEDVEEHQKPDGEKIYVQVFKAPVRNFKGEVVGTQGIFWDVSDRKRTEQALKDSKALYLSLVESLPMNVFRKDLEGTFTFGNKLFCETLGRPLEGIIGKTDYDFFPKELADKYRADDGRVARTGQVFEDVEEHQKPSGEKIYVQVFKTPVRNFKGEVIGTQGMFWDVTERKRVEEALVHERYLMNSLMDSFPDSIYFKDQQSRFTKISTSQAQRFGLTDASEALGKSDFDFFTEEHARPAFEDEQEVMTTGQPIVGKEEKETWPDGKARWVSTTKMPLRDKEGKIVGTFGVSRDITDRKEAEDELKRTAAELARSNTDLEQFAYVASHDLQEPLRMVASYAQLLEKRYRGKLDSDADDFISFIVDGATRMQALINALLTYSRVGTRAKPFEPTDCEEVFERVFTNLQMAMYESSAIVSHDQLPTLMADGAQLEQLFQNLIGNAIKFRGKEPPRVHVSAEQYGNEWLFSVQDNGIGIDMEYAERIFVIFQRLHSRSEYPGTGIGLAVCKKIVERHGGRIWVESQPGKGSTFYFTIPIAGEQQL
jgi:PAS domain S-box-containing protein